MPPEAVGIAGCSGRRVRSRRRPCPPCRHHAAWPAWPPSLSGMSVMSASVVRSSDAIDAAFCSAIRSTLVGSMIPACIMSTYSFVSASKPCASVLGGLHLLDHDGALEPGVLHDPPDRLLERPPHDVDAGRLVARELEVVEGLRGAEQRHAAARHDALLHGRPRRVERILDARLLLLHLGLGRGADLDDGDAAGQLGQPLLQLLPVVVRGRLLDLRPDLLDPALDLLGLTRRRR